MGLLWIKSIFWSKCFHGFRILNFKIYDQNPGIDLMIYRFVANLLIYGHYFGKEKKWYLILLLISKGSTCTHKMDVSHYTFIYNTFKMFVIWQKLVCRAERLALLCVWFKVEKKTIPVVDKFVFERFCFWS